MPLPGDCERRLRERDKSTAYANDQQWRVSRRRETQTVCISELANRPQRVRLYGCQKGGRKFGKDRLRRPATTAKSTPNKIGRPPYRAPFGSTTYEPPNTTAG